MNVNYVACGEVALVWERGTNLTLFYILVPSMNFVQLYLPSSTDPLIAPKMSDSSIWDDDGKSPIADTWMSQ